MIEYLTELVKELNKQGYGWVLPIEVERDFVRVRKEERGGYLLTYCVSKNKEEFEVSLSVTKEDGSVTEVSPPERQTIGQVVDYIME